jgi:hypothetical protein
MTQESMVAAMIALNIFIATVHGHEDSSKQKRPHAPLMNYYKICRTSKKSKYPYHCDK